MTLLFRDQYIGKLNTLDIPIGYKPPGTQPGDFMVLRIITLNEREPIPNVPSWTLLTHEYSNGFSQFVFTKISDINQDKITIIRKKTGTNFISVYSWYSDTTNEIILQPDSLLIPTSFNKKKQHKFNIDNYKLEYECLENECNIKLLNSRTYISFIIKENNRRYTIDLPQPKLYDAILNNNNTVILKWDEQAQVIIEISNDGIEWNKLVETTKQEYIVDNLLPDKCYYFRVYALSNDAISKPSNEINITTNGDILLRSSSYSLASTMNPRITVSPKLISKGDLLLMQVSYSNNVNIVKISNGWKLLQELKTDDVSSSIYWKRATRKEPASYIVQHDGQKDVKLLVAVAAFYSVNDKPIRVQDSKIQYNLPSKCISYPAVASEYDYSLGIGLSVRNLESNLKLSTDSTLIWDIDRNLRTTGTFKAYHNVTEITPQTMLCNFGSSIAATVVLFEDEKVTELPPLTPTGLRAKKVEGTIISLTKGII